MLPADSRSSLARDSPEVRPHLLGDAWAVPEVFLSSLWRTDFICCSFTCAGSGFIFTIVAHILHLFAGLVA
jgi:hypothetical protein